MTDPLSHLKSSHLHSLKSVGYHALNSAREKGEDTAKPLAFVGLVTMAVGAKMFLEAYQRMQGGTLGR
jgi:hypothetical protein